LNDRGIIDGLFAIEVPNSYALDQPFFNELEFQPIDEEPESFQYWIEELEEGESISINIQEKNITYVVKSILGDATELSPLLLDNPTELTRDGAIVVVENSNPSEDITIDGQYEAIDVAFSTEQREQEILQATIPMNNCEGSESTSIEFSESKTQVHEYNWGVEGKISAEIPIAVVKVIPEISAVYGYRDGEIRTIDLSATLSAKPGTNQIHRVTFLEIWEQGTATIKTPDSTEELVFETNTNIVLRTDVEALDCDD
jgi:hypothetical protein